MGVTLTEMPHGVGPCGTSPSLERTQTSHHSNRNSTLQKSHQRPRASSGCQDAGVNSDIGLHTVLICKKLPPPTTPAQGLKNFLLPVVRKTLPGCGCLMTALEPVQERAHLRKRKIPVGREDFPREGVAGPKPQG